MSAARHFKVIGDYATFRPDGPVRLEEAVELVAESIALARAQGVKKLLVVTSEWTGFGPPGISDRYELAKRWAAAASGAVRVAVVARPEMIDAKKFGVTVARNRGFIADIFASETEATAWLQDGG